MMTDGRLKELGQVNAWGGLTMLQGQELIDEIERLRKALDTIASGEAIIRGMQDIAREALGKGNS